MTVGICILISASASNGRLKKSMCALLICTISGLVYPMLSISVVVERVECIMCVSPIYAKALWTFRSMEFPIG